MKKFWILLMLLTSSKSHGAHYLIEHQDNMIHIKATFKAHELKLVNNNIELYIPEIIWGTNFAKQITNIKTNGNYDAQKQIVHLEPQMDLQIDYDIQNIPREELLENFADFYNHFISKEKFYMLGLGLFIYPVNYQSKVTIQVKSEVKKVVYSTFPYFYEDNIITCSISDLNKLVLIGSNDLQYLTYENSMDLIMWVENKNLQNKFEQIALPAFNKHEQFWQENGAKKQKLSIIFPEPIKSKDFVRAGGTVINEHTILFFLTANTQNSVLTQLFKHEYLHFWFGKLLQGPKWFIEGFTDYYVEKINLYYDKNVYNFVNTYNIKAQKYFSSLASHWNDKIIEKYFFEISPLKKIPYLKGYLIAGQMDSIIDLDRALKKMTKLCKKDKKYCEFTIKNFLKCVGKSF